MGVRKISLFLVFGLLASRIVLSQKYSFTNYSVEQGLAQSQAHDIAQDEYGYIWVATLGGISRFDGFKFHNYTKKDGLLSLLSLRVFACNKKIYFGTQEGIQSYDGDNFESFGMPKSLKSNAIVDIVSGKTGGVFFRAAAKLFSIQKDNAVLQVKEFEQDIVTTIATGREGDLYAAVNKKGIYRLENNQWKLFLDLAKVNNDLVVQRIFFTSIGQTIVLTNKGVFSVAGGNLVLIISKDKVNPQLTSIAEDDKGRLWIGTVKGAYLLEKTGEINYVGTASGLTDNSIFEIIKDREGNLWFATDGDGISKLNNTPLTYFSNAQGINGNVVMGIAVETANRIWFGTSEHGLQKYEDGKFSSYMIPSGHPQAQKMNSLFFDSNKQLWIGTLGGGLWIYDGKSYKEVLTENANHFNEIISIYEDSEKTIWVCISSGLFYYTNGSMRKVKELDKPCFSVIEKSPGTILVGAAEGLWQVNRKLEVVKLSIPGKTIGTVNCFAKWRDYILLGTEEAGIVFWNPVSGNTLQCSSKNGLSSDFIFSLYADGTKTIFAGTVNAISKIEIKEAANDFFVKNYSSSNSLYGPECNLNAVQKTSDGKLWFGTTKGLVIYNQKDTFNRTTAPLIYLTDVKLFSSTINQEKNAYTTEAWNQIPHKLKLSHKENQLTFDFTGLFFTNPSSIKYRYRLEGADTGYSDLITTPEVIFSNMAPGEYSFKAYAVTEEGLRSENSIDFPFIIEAPFYQKNWFRLLAILSLITSGIFIQYGRTRIKTRRAAAIRSIRLEEQQKIQERTSEDLHDDLGNKITRITVLADVLSNKVDKEDLEKKKLIEQIKENAQSLYLGTKDIISSLAPDNDSLYSIVERCHSFGSHLFDETGIEFNIEGQDERFKEIKLPMQVNRNFVMIVKEALNNALKHSGAAHVSLRVTGNDRDEIFVSITDDGTGIPEKLMQNGNGLVNMKKRAIRLGGDLIINNLLPSGTSLTLTFKIPYSNG